MAVKYTLYLDESGDFDRDLEVAWKNECLVGGILAGPGSKLSETRANQILVTSWKDAVPSDSGLPPEKILKKAKHSTELAGAQKALMVQNVLDRAEEYGEFIIFENYDKARIVNSTLTYINIMVDGIIQLLNRLVTSHPGEKVKLEVIAGFRKDTSVPVTNSRTEGYIREDECLERIRERLELSRVKNHMIYSGRAEVSFRYEDDKVNGCLILSDYICNFYITRTAPLYREVFREGLSLGEYLLQKYKTENCFSLYGNAENEKVSAYINSQDYAGALYDICTEMIKQQSSVCQILSAFLQLPDRARQNYLKTLGHYINNLIGGERNLALGEKVLDHAGEIALQLEAAGKEDLTFSLDIVLYRLAICSHRGQLERMEELFRECRELLRRGLARTENLDYAFLYYNRYAVYLMDTFRVREAYDLLVRVEKQFAAYELVLEDLPDISVPGTRSFLISWLGYWVPGCNACGI